MIYFRGLAWLLLLCSACKFQGQVLNSDGRDIEFHRIIFIVLRIADPSSVHLSYLSYVDIHSMLRNNRE